MKQIKITVNNQDYEYLNSIGSGKASLGVRVLLQCAKSNSPFPVVNPLPQIKDPIDSSLDTAEERRSYRRFLEDIAAKTNHLPQYKEPVATHDEILEEMKKVRTASIPNKKLTKSPKPKTVKKKAQIRV